MLVQIAMLHEDSLCGGNGRVILMAIECCELLRNHG
jgi:hypothetical protein